MGILNKQMKEKEKVLNKAAPFSVADALFVPTGFDAIDYPNGSICTGMDGEDFPNVGLALGKISLFFGNSQGGKTTLALQVMDALLERFTNGDGIILDFERSLTSLKERVCQVTNCAPDEFDERYSHFKQNDLCTEFVKDIIFEIIEAKKKLKKSDMEKWYNRKGEEILIYPPTIILLDSIPTMKPVEVMNESKLDNNMVAGKMAAANKNLMTTILNHLETYNITLLCINHLSTKINTNPYAPRKVILPGMADDENLPGGGAIPFVASYAFRLTSGAELKKGKDLNIEGRKTELRTHKTREGFNNQRVPLVFTARNGFSNLLSNYILLKDAKKFKGSGNGGFYFSELPDSKFKQSGFVKLYKNDEAFREVFDNNVEDHYMEILLSKFKSLDDTDESVSSSRLGGLDSDLDDDFNDEDE